MVRRAFAAGGAGYALKSDPHESLVTAVRAVAAGSVYLSPDLPAPVSSEDVLEEQSDPLDSLSPREMEVFRRVVAGDTTEQISSALGISTRTVEAHRARINRKLGARSPADVVRIAAMRGQLPPGKPSSGQ